MLCNEVLHCLGSEKSCQNMSHSALQQSFEQPYSEKSCQNLLYIALCNHVLSHLIMENHVKSLT